MTISIDLKAVFNLGWKALAMFGTGTIGIMIGGPLAVYLIALVSPETVGGAGADAVWRGLATLAGSWIGGGANQAAMLEIYEYNTENYAGMVIVDIVVANIWMAIILIGIGKRNRINKWLKADTSSIEDLKEKVSSFSESVKRNPSLTDIMIIAALAFGAEILEFHAVFSKNDFGPDVTSSLTIDEIKTLSEAVRNIEKAQAHPVDKSDNSKFSELKSIFEKSLAINKDLQSGHVIQFSDLEAKKPANRGIPASSFEAIIGKRIVKNMKQWDFLTIDDIK